MVTLEYFTARMHELGAAFGHTPDEATILQYYKALGSLSATRLEALMNWAISRLDSSFPRIAVLHAQAEQQGWFKTERARPPRQDFVQVECPACSARFVVPRARLEEDARKQVTYICPNREHWHCTETFHAADIAARETRWPAPTSPLQE